MPVTARPLPPARARTGPPPARPVHKPAAAASHAARAKPTFADRLQITLFMSALAVAAVVAIAVIWEFGAARTLSLGSGPGGGAANGRDRPTVYYRDMRDGRVMVMEIGADGTRIKGTVAKSDLGIAADMGADIGGSSRPGEVTSADRVNALGSSFRK
jgi:hypothetical protein